tara:strand:+ start:7392 stop:7553 length:162 start_codon:yes stop_codon:yes gene_type:complete
MDNMLTDILTFLVCIILGFTTVNLLSGLIVFCQLKRKQKTKSNIVKWDIDKEA